MPLLWRSSRESRSERCKRAFLLAPICKVLLAPTLVSDRATADRRLTAPDLATLETTEQPPYNYVVLVLSGFC